MIYRSNEGTIISVFENCCQFFILITAFFLLNTAHAQKLYINEFLASNTTTNAEILDFDDYSDWIELYNGEDYSIDLGGYFLTDNLSNPTKWQIPAGAVIAPHGFLLFWADGMDDQPGNNYVRDAEPYSPYTTQYYHLNFKLSRAGEALALFAPDTSQIDAIEFTLQIPDVSFGRKPDGAASWFYFGEPTPQATNSAPATLNTEVAGKAEFIAQASYFDGSALVQLSASTPTAEIRYTLDGSRPGSHSAKYNSPFSLSSTKVVRTRVFDGDKLPGPIVTRTYFVDESPSIATLSIGVFPDVMFGAEKGIYPNLLKDRELPVSVEFFEPNKKRGFQIDAGLKISGQASFKYPQKPLTFYFRDRFGPEEINYPVFPSRELQKFNALYLRNSGSPDNRFTLFRDALQHSLVINRMDLDLQAYRPASTFINGRYWGIYNIRDKINAKYLATLHGVDPRNLDLLEYDFSPVPVEIKGDAENYNQLLNYLKQNSLQNAENYDYIKTQIDIDEYMNYLITEIFCDNINWLDTNVKWWRERTKNGKWRWILLDMDWGFGTPWPNFSSNVNNRTLEMAVGTPGNPVFKQEWSTFLLRKMFKSPEFTNEFIQRFAGHLNTTFHKDRVVHITDSLKTNLLQEMPRHIDRWDEFTQPALGGDPPIANMTQWNSYVEVMRDFALRRQDIMTRHIVDFFNLSGTAKLQLAVAQSESGRIVINGVEMPLNKSLTYFRDVPIVAKAVPAIGYRFVKWQGALNSTKDSASLTLNANTNLTAVFESINAQFLPPVISADRILTQALSPYLAKGDVTIESGATLIVQPGVEILMPEKASIYVRGKIQMRGTARLPIIIRANSASGVERWGALCFDSAGDSSVISHVKLQGATNGVDRQKYTGAISAYRSKLSLSNVEIIDAVFPVFVQYGEVIIRECLFYIEKTADLINIKYAASALIENNDLRGYRSYDTDAIDLDGVDSAIVRSNRIYNFMGFNSDGIDLGETCRNVRIENNLIFNCADKGISIGQASTAVVKNNVLVNCGQGIGIKDSGSYAKVDRNTFYGNAIGIAVFEKNIGAGGGSADVVNSIFSRSKNSPYFVDNLSDLSINYSICATMEIPGASNIFSDPLLANEFRLQVNSPAIDSGDPANENDPDGTRADMGAYPFDITEKFSALITEIHYAPAQGENDEFIEIFNASAQKMDISGYTLSSPIDFTFPLGSILEAGEYIIVARDGDRYSGKGYRTFTWDGVGLADNWGNVELKNSAGKVVDLVNYNQITGWPAVANGGGPSLELRDTQQENLYYANWRASFTDGGSPGAANKVTSISKLYLNEIMARNSSFIADENGEFDDWIEIYNGGDRPVDLGGLFFSEDSARGNQYRIQTTAAQETTIQPGEFKVLWADNDESQGVLHLGFQLNGDGEHIFLSQAVADSAHVIDDLTFGPQAVDASVGRLPDGSENVSALQVATPGSSNDNSRVLQKGILLVNGVSFGTYGEEIYSAYWDKAFYGDYPITFWDCFAAPDDGYPAYISQPVGHGAVPREVLFQYSAIIWVGNNYGGDLASWQETPILPYLQLGGNVLLMARLGDSFLDPGLTDYLGVSWREKRTRISNCNAVHGSLESMIITGPQSLVSVFDAALTNPESKLLFRETVSFNGYRGLGAWRRPVAGGRLKQSGGQFVFISGRPYRYNHNQLRRNIEYILGNFFHEPKESAVSRGSDFTVVKTFALQQNFPNPFNPRTAIQFDLPRVAVVSLKIYDIRGMLVRHLIRDKKQPAGRYHIIWDGKNDGGISVSSGNYFYKLLAGEFTAVKKMLLLR